MATIKITNKLRRYFEDRYLPVTESGCWLWMGAQNDGGYGVCFIEGIHLRAHRIAYEIHIGPIPPELQLDHLCRVRCCVNPAHLEPVTITENLRRGINAESSRTHCPQGHPYSESNTIITRWTRKDGRMCIGRQCKICHYSHTSRHLREWRKTER